MWIIIATMLKWIFLDLVKAKAPKSQKSTFQSENPKHLDRTLTAMRKTQFCNMSALVQSLPKT